MAKAKKPKKVVKKAKAPKKAAKKRVVKKAKAPKKAAKKRVVKKAKKATKARKVAKKKPAKRKAAKLQSARKLIAKSMAHGDPITLRIYDIHDVPDEKHFYFVNGHRVKNVKELAEVMDHIEHEVFDYHVNESRNDFYSWVAHVFEDLELAEKLLGVTGPKHLQFTIYKHVADKALKKK